MNNEPASREAWTNVGQCDYKRSLGYRYLEIRPEDVKPAPFFATNLTRIARLINRGRSKDDPASSRMHPLDYLGFSEDPPCTLGFAEEACTNIWFWENVDLAARIAIVPRTKNGRWL